MALYFLKGSLPWQALQAPNRQEKYRLILELKQKTGMDELCMDLHPEFATYMHYLRHMENPDRPDYAHLRTLFDRVFRFLDFEHDHVFEWTIREFDRLSTCQPPLPEKDAETLRRARPRTDSAGHGRRGTCRARAVKE